MSDEAKGFADRVLSVVFKDAWDEFARSREREEQIGNADAEDYSYVVDLSDLFAAQKADDDEQRASG